MKQVKKISLKLNQQQKNKLKKKLQLIKTTIYMKIRKIHYKYQKFNNLH